MAQPLKLLGGIYLKHFKTMVSPCKLVYKFGFVVFLIALFFTHGKTPFLTTKFGRKNTWYFCNRLWDRLRSIQLGETLRLCDSKISS